LGTPHCTFAKGLAKPESPPSEVPFFELPVLLPPKRLSVFGSERFPNPAFRNASFVPSELSIFVLFRCVSFRQQYIEARLGYGQGWGSGKDQAKSVVVVGPASAWTDGGVSERSSGLRGYALVVAGSWWKPLVFSPGNRQSEVTVERKRRAD
jgi:hypothetical protein